MPSVAAVDDDVDIAPPWLVTRACRAKRAYATRAVARRVARRRSRELHERLWAYRCWFCPVFHIGHARERRPRPWWRPQRADRACQAWEHEPHHRPRHLSATYLAVLGAS
jgi:hypothetical protein